MAASEERRACGPKAVECGEGGSTHYSSAIKNSPAFELAIAASIRLFSAFPERRGTRRNSRATGSGWYV